MATPVWTPTGPVAGAPVDITTETAAPRPATVPPPTPARRPSTPPENRPPRERPSWLIPAAIALLVLLLLVGAIGIYLKTRPTTGTPVAHATPSAKTSPKTSPKATPKASPTPTNGGGALPVPTYAPSSATPVTSVAFCIQSTHPCAGVSASDYTNCKLNSSCKVMVEMKYSSPQNGQVGYTLKFFDRCTGTTTNLPGTSFTPSGFTRVDLLKVVTLPSGSKSAALVAVTNSPAVASSAPLLLGSDTC
jgi:hypothetical protein